MRQKKIIYSILLALIALSSIIVIFRAVSLYSFNPQNFIAQLAEIFVPEPQGSAVPLRAAGLSLVTVQKGQPMDRMFIKTGTVANKPITLAGIESGAGAQEKRVIGKYRKGGEMRLEYEKEEQTNIRLINPPLFQYINPASARLTIRNEDGAEQNIEPIVDARGYLTASLDYTPRAGDQPFISYEYGIYESKPYSLAISQNMRNNTVEIEDFAIQENDIADESGELIVEGRASKIKKSLRSGGSGDGGTRAESATTHAANASSVNAGKKNKKADIDAITPSLHDSAGPYIPLSALGAFAKERLFEVTTPSMQGPQTFHIFSDGSIELYQGVALLDAHEPRFEYANLKRIWQPYRIKKVTAVYFQQAEYVDIMLQFSTIQHDDISAHYRFGKENGAYVNKQEYKIINASPDMVRENKVVSRVIGLPPPLDAPGVWVMAPEWRLHFTDSLNGGGQAGIDQAYNNSYENGMKNMVAAGKVLISETATAPQASAAKPIEIIENSTAKIRIKAGTIIYTLYFSGKLIAREDGSRPLSLNIAEGSPLLSFVSSNDSYLLDLITLNPLPDITANFQKDFQIPADLIFIKGSGDGAFNTEQAFYPMRAIQEKDANKNNIDKVEFMMDGSSTPRYYPVFEVANWTNPSLPAFYGELDGKPMSSLDYIISFKNNTFPEPGIPGVLIFQYLGIVSHNIRFYLDPIADGANAIDALGQTDGNPAAPGPIYTKALINDGPNRLGFSNAEGGIALDSTGDRLFVSDTFNNRVLVYNLNADDTLIDRIPDNVLGQTNFYSRTAATTQAGMNNPFGLAYDSANTRLFVADNANNRILVYNVAAITDGENAANVLGQANFTSSTAATTQAGMNYPYGLAYDSTNTRLFAVNVNNNRVMVYDVASIIDGENAANVLGQANFTSSTAATTQAGMKSPYNVAYDPTNTRLFVADGLNNRVTVYDVAAISNGENAVNVLGQANFASSTAATTQAGMSNPQGLAYDPTNTRLFVGDSSNNRVTVYNVATSTIANGQNAANVLGQAGFTTATFATTQAGVDYLNGIAYDSVNSRLFAVDTNNSRVTVYSVPNGSITNGSNAIDALGQTDGNVSAPGPIYVKALINDGPNRLGLQGPDTGILFDSAGDRLFVSDSGNNRVLVYNLNANDTLIDRIPDNVLGQVNFYTATIATTQAGMNYPQGLAYDSTNTRLFVADASNNRVTVYDVSTITDGENAVNVLGQANFTSSTGAVTQGGLNNPVSIAYNATNAQLFVADNINNRVIVYDVSAITDGENAANVLGQANFTSSTAATTQAGMSRPAGLANDLINNLLFVADGSNKRIMIYNIITIVNGENAVNVLGQANFTTATVATTQAGMNNPFGLAYDSVNSRLFAGDGLNNRVLVYDILTIVNGENAANVLGQANFTSSTAATTQAGMNNPYGLAYDSVNSRLFVGEVNNHRVTIFDVAAPNIIPAASTPQISNASGIILITSSITDADANGVKAKIEYSLDGGATYYKAYITSASVSQGTIDTVNSNAYQIGATDSIETTSATTLTINWDSSSATNGGGAITNRQIAVKVRITPNDGVIDGTAVTSPTFTIDNSFTPVTSGGSGGGGGTSSSGGTSSGSTSGSTSGTTSIYQDAGIYRGPDISVNSIATTSPAIPSVFPLAIPLNISKGSSGAAVHWLQSLLIALNINTPATRALIKAGATGYFGPVTQQALKDFQRIIGIPATGNFGPLTRAYIEKMERR